MNPIHAVLSGFRNYANFKGRASRPEYWWFYAFFVVWLIVIFVVSVGWFPALLPLWGIYIAAMLLPLWSVTVRRLHDVDRPGTWAALGIMPFAGVRLTRLLTQPGTSGPNRYGPDPLRAGADGQRIRPPAAGARPPEAGAAGTPEPSAALPCPKCGWEPWPDALFCADCGARL